MMDRLSQIRQAEAASHRDAYASHELFAPGSWLAKPVKTVLDLLPLFGGYDAPRRWIWAAASDETAFRWRGFSEAFPAGFSALTFWTRRLRS